MIKPVVLDFDESVLPFQEEVRLDLRQYQELVRFGASKKTWNHFLKTNLMPQLNLLQNNPSDFKTLFFLGSGDFHHLSLPLIQLHADKKSFQLIILDNHPDNMRYLFGVHCGSWVSFAAKLPFISHIHVVGMTSSDISFSHLWENRIKPLYSGKLTYWCKGIDTKWIDKIGLKKAYRSFTTVDELIEQFLAEQSTQSDPIYLSIDKDVLSTEVIQTNWDQGDLSKQSFFTLLRSLKDRVFCADVTGEISFYTYQNRLKQFLSQLDEQPQFDALSVQQYQKTQHQLNQTILDLLG